VQAFDKVQLRSKYRPLLEDDRIRKWVDYVARGSAITAEVYLRRLGRVCEEKRLLPSDLLNKDEEWLWNFLNDLVSEMEIKGKAGGYIQSTLKAIKSWLSFNGIEIRRKLKVRRANDTPTLRGNQPITTFLLRQLYSASPLTDSHHATTYQERIHGILFDPEISPKEKEPFDPLAYRFIAPLMDRLKLLDVLLKDSAE
jgi:hypothetical protein